VLWGDALVGRFDARLDRTSPTLHLLGLWLEDEALADDLVFVEALVRGVERYLRFLAVDRLDASGVQIGRNPPTLGGRALGVARGRAAENADRVERMRSMRFRTTLLQGDGTATGFEVPPEVVESLGRGKRPPVTVTINGYTYRNTVAVYGGVFMLGVSAEHRASAGVAGGDQIDVELELDTAPREVVVPNDLASALAAEQAAQETFDGLSYSNKSWHVLQVTGAKSDETRRRRIANRLRP
jgi:hypothetical protein